MKSHILLICAVIFFPAIACKKQGTYSSYGPKLVYSTWGDVNQKEPRWFLNPPDGDKGMVYFVGQSSTPEADQAQALITAKLDSQRTFAEQINTKIRSLVTSAKVSSGVGADQDVEKVTKYVVGALVDNLNISGAREVEKAYAQYEEKDGGRVTVTYVGFSKLGMDESVYNKQLKMALDGFKKSGPDANPEANRLVDETMAKLEGGR